MTIINAHIQEDTITEYAIYPTHEERNDSQEFIRSKNKLKKDGHYKCFICGCLDDLESHHIFEWAFENALDLNKVKECLKSFDFYGYSKSMTNIQLISLDDIRNQLILCEKHHRHELCGIHHINFALWISQKVVKNGIETVPQSEEDLKEKEKQYNLNK